MAVDIEAVCNGIQTIVRGSSLIRSAPPIADWPDSIDDSVLPIALTRPGAGEWIEVAMGEQTRKGKFITDIFVRADALGMVYEGIRDTLDIISDVGARLAADPTLGGLVFNSTVRDKGLVILKLGEAPYRGTTIETEVEEDV